MDFRKIIAFGKSSFVISLPKGWLESHRLEKGDLVYLNEDGENLVVSASEKEVEKEEIRTKILTNGKDLLRIRREINSAYINYSDSIVVEGKKLAQISSEVVTMIHNLMGLEIIEQDANRIVAKDFMRLKDVNVVDYIRKADIIVRSILGDLKNSDYVKYDDIVSRQDGVSRMYLLILKLLKAGLTDVRSLRKLNLPIEKIFSYYRYNFSLQNISINLTSIAKEMKSLSELGKNLDHVREAIAYFESSYLEILKVIHTDNLDRAYKFSERRDIDKEQTLEILKKGDHYDSIARSLLWLHAELHEMAHRVYS